MPNIGYLGAGYDHIHGNPHSSDHFDPGYRQSIFDLTKYCGDVTSDNRYLIPQNSISFGTTQPCSLAFETTFVESLNDYSNGLMNHFHFDIDAESKVKTNTSFSASNEYKRKARLINSQAQSIGETFAQCSVYSISLEKINRPELTQSFKKAVGLLPSGLDDLIKTYGTFFIKEMVMGARYGQQVILPKAVSDSFFQSQRKVAFKIMALLSISNDDLEVGFDNLTDEEKVVVEIISKFSSEIAIISIGLRPTSRNASEWANYVIENPMPIEITLEPIFQLLTPQNFPDDDEIEWKQQIFRDKLEEMSK